MNDFLNFDEQPLKLASRKRRIAAYLFDYLLLAIPVALAVSNSLNDPDNVRLLTVVSLTMLLLFFAKDCMGGRSPGKRLMGIMVRDRDDVQQVPSAGRLLLRNVLLVIWLIEFIVMCTNDDKQRLGDQLAKTKVIRSPEPLKVWPRVAVGSAVMIALVACIFTSVIGGMKKSVPYTMSVEAIHNNKTLEIVLGGISEVQGLPKASIHNGTDGGNAHFQFKVSGPKGQAIVATRLTRPPLGEWQLMELNTVD
jgi:uncharacterized RDD family membrane protein YckC